MDDEDISGIPVWRCFSLEQCAPGLVTEEES